MSKTKKEKKKKSKAYNIMKTVKEQNSKYYTIKNDKD